MNIPDSELRALLVLNLMGKKRMILDFFAEEKRPSEVLAGFGPEDFPSFPFNPDREAEECLKKGVRLLTWFDEDYPELLKQIIDPPLLLYMKGSIEIEDQSAIAIVGTRHPSFYGRNQTQKFAGELAAKGLTIVSGCAKGIDQAAHDSALNVSYGRTIAVLGCGVDVNYPRGSDDLRKKIAERGAVLSEYPLGTSPRAENFPKRNRIISGLSQGVLVVEAHSISGSLITAHEALDQGREVFAIPGPIDQLTSRGTHRLIKEGACLVESPDEVLEVLAFSLKGQIESPRKEWQLDLKPVLNVETNADLGSEDERLLLKSLSDHPMAYEEIAGKCPLIPGEIASLLTHLELRRKIQRQPDGRFKVMD